MDNRLLGAGSRGVTFLLAVVVLLTGCIGTSEPPKTEAAMILKPPKEIISFELMQGKQRFANQQLKGRWSLFFFGYTRCPDVCPTELFTLAEMMRKIEEQPEQVVETPQVVFISVDPQQDTPEAVDQYVRYYHPKFVGVTAEQAMVDRLVADMGAIYERVYYHNGKELVFDPEEGVPEMYKDAYLVNHSATIFLLNPEGELHAIFSTPHIPETLAKDLSAIQKSW